MTLTSGTRLGPYEVIGPIGAGGMGEVCRARDAKLNRFVALKVLHGHLAAYPDRLARFEREAQAVAALSHPGILAIHDFGSADAVTYAVMELLEGGTLRERLDSGPMSPSRAVELAIQIVRALAAAHDKGIVHRDLKCRCVPSPQTAARGPSTPCRLGGKFLTWRETGACSSLATRPSGRSTSTGLGRTNLGTSASSTKARPTRSHTTAGLCSSPIRPI